MKGQNPPNKPLKIAFCRSSSLGDVILASSCLDYLKKNEIPYEGIWLGAEPSLDLLSLAYPQIKVIDIKKGQGLKSLFHYAHMLRKYNFIIDLQRNLRSRVISAILFVFYFVPTFTYSKRQFFRLYLIVKSHFKHKQKLIAHTTQVNGQTEVEKRERRQYLLMQRGLAAGLSKFGYDTKGFMAGKPALDLFYGEVAGSLIKDKKVLAVAPGAAYATKRCPEEKLSEIFLELKNKLMQNRDVSIPELLILGSSEDKSIGDRLLEKIDWQNQVSNQCGKISLSEVASKLKFVSVLLSNDSALGHLAEAVGTPVATIFGPTSESFGFAPWRRESRAFSLPLNCRPCSKHGDKKCRFDNLRCFMDLPAKEIAEYLYNQLQNTRQKKGLFHEQENI